jgi:hypothetical protein
MCNMLKESQVMKSRYSAGPIILAGVVVACAAALQAVPPANDNFASRTVLAGASGDNTSTTLDATYEAGEPEHDPYGCGENSIWWTWTAPYSGVFTFDTVGTAKDVVLAVYTGTSLPALQRVKYARQYGASEPGWVQFQAGAGTTYQIAIAGMSHFGGGLARVRYYPDALTPWITQLVATGITTRVDCAMDGSMLTLDYHDIYTVRFRSNFYGYRITDAVWRQAISNIVLRDRHDKIIAASEAWPGSDLRYVADLNKRMVLMVEPNTSNLSVFTVRNGALRLVAQRTFSTWFTPMIDGKSIVVTLQDGARALCALEVYDAKLATRKWAIPTGTGDFHWARVRHGMNALPAYRNGVVFRMCEVGNIISMDVTRRGGALTRYSMPVTAGLSNLYYLPCERGDMLYWYGTHYTNSGLTLLTVNGDVPFANQPLPDAGNVWNGCAFDGKRFHAVVAGATNYMLYAYRVGKTLTRQGGVPQNQLQLLCYFERSRVYLRRTGIGTIGMDAYDAALRRRRGGTPVSPFNQYSYLGEGAFLRVLFGAAEDTYTIENTKGKGIVGTHVVPH